MKNEQRQEIRLRDMIYKVLCAWRLLAVLTISLAVLLGGGKFVMDTVQYCRINEENQPTVITREDLEAELTPAQLSTVKEAETLRELVKEKEAYVEKSLYLSIDPYNEHVVTLLYYVDAKTTLDLINGTIIGKGGELAKAYAAYINTNLFVDSQDENAMYYREVVQAECLTDSAYQFAVTVKGATKEGVQTLAEQVKPLVEQGREQLAKTMGSHTLKLTNESYALTVDRQLMDEKEQFFIGFNTLRKNLSTLETGLNGSQLELYQFGTVPQLEEEVSVPQKPTLRLKYVIVGGVLGFFFGVVWVALMYMTGSRLRNAEELADIYGVDTLGTLPTKKRKRKFGFVDRLIERFFTREKWTKDQRIAFTVAHLKMMSEKHQADQLVLMTNLKLTRHEKSLVEEVVTRLQQQGITVTLGEQIHQNLDSYERVRACGYAVLLEKEGTSFYTDIQQELTLCRQADIQIVGAVTFVQ